MLQIVPPAYFKMLTNAQYQQRSHATLTSRPQFLFMVDGNLWCAQENEISFWSISKNISVFFLYRFIHMYT